MKSLKAIKWLLLVSGVLLIVLGCTMFATPVENYVGLAVFISIAMIFSGLSDIINFFSEEKEFRSGWLLASGLITLLFGVWLIVRPIAFETLLVAIPFVFSGWVIAAGLTRAIGSIELKGLDVRGWGWIMAFAVVGILFGVILLFNPSLTVGTISYMIPLLFISHGIDSGMMFFGMNRIGRFFRRRRRSSAAVRLNPSARHPENKCGQKTGAAAMHCRGGPGPWAAGTGYFAFSAAASPARMPIVE